MTLHLHLDPVGGVAGDMFVAAILDYRPDLEPGLLAALRAAGLDALVTVRRFDHRDAHGITGSRFDTRAASAEPHPHRSLRTIRKLLSDADLTPPVRDRALAIFALLAEAEGRVHGVAAADVTFHEVGAWDSIADTVSAAWLIEQLDAGWSCGPLPAGRGWVDSAHGRLPLPAPATALLLEGYPLFQDELHGERVTPTGAALLRHLDPDFEPQRTPRRLRGGGTGFGSKTFTGISNTLRLLAYGAAAEPARWRRDRVTVCQFEIDDQTGEDLAVAVERLRASVGVLDVLQSAGFGKKGRLVAQLQLLVEPAALDAVIARCFAETSTLGVRYRTTERALLARERLSVDAGGATVRVKRAERPDGRTVKAELDDLAGAGDRRRRDALRRAAEIQFDQEPADRD